MVVLIVLKIFMKAKCHFHVEIQIRSQVYNITRFNRFCLLRLEGEGGGEGICLLCGSKQGMENIFIKKIDKVVEQPIT